MLKTNFHLNLWPILCLSLAEILFKISIKSIFIVNTKFIIDISFY